MTEKPHPKSGPGSRGKDYGAIFIYALADPRTNAIRYIGKARDPLYRHKQHVRVEGQRRNHRSAWLARLHLDGLKPTLLTLEACEPCEWRDRERAWILALRSAGHSLVNGTDGGDGVPEGFLRGAPSPLTKTKMNLARQVAFAKSGRHGPDLEWAAAFIPFGEATLRALKMLHERPEDGAVALRPDVRSDDFKAARARAHEAGAAYRASASAQELARWKESRWRKPA